MGQGGRTLPARHPGRRASVRNLTNYGAFIEIEEGIDGLLARQRHELGPQGQPSQRRSSKGRQGQVRRARTSIRSASAIALGLKQMANDPWEGDIPGRYHPGDVKKGKVTKLTNFGVFVELEPGLEGLLHISELADDKVESPEEVVKVGDEIEVKSLARRCRRPQDRPEPQESQRKLGRRGRRRNGARWQSSGAEPAAAGRHRLRCGPGLFPAGKSPQILPVVTIGQGKRLACRQRIKAAAILHRGRGRAIGTTVIS